MNKQILLVDDDRAVLDSLRRMLYAERNVWELTLMDDPAAALDCLRDRQFDAAVLDVKMPGISGLELLSRMQQMERARDTPVVMLTGLADRDLKRRALELGAADLLTKPVEPADLVARLRSVLRLKACQDELKAYNDSLERRVEQRTTELFYSRLDIIWRLGKVAEQRDEDTGNHVVRVGFYSRLVAEALGAHHGFQESTFLAAPLHDIGKIGIPDRILLKRGALSPGELATMKQHCRIGERILREESRVGTAFFHWRAVNSQFATAEFQNPILEVAAEIALTHHERWDGKGYPQGLAREDIPLASRIVAACDVYDALTSTRPYRSAYGEAEALEMMQKESGKHFDPDVYKAFVKALPAVRSVRAQFPDTMTAPALEGAWGEHDLVCR
jgi:putative two-component system response regulator